MKRETDTFFNHLVRRDAQPARALHRRLHLRERAAGAALRLPGRRRRRVPQGALSRPTRRGILGQGSVLVQTSLANRTSPVLRGKWVMEVLLGTPPPPPPPNVPALEETGEAKDGKLLTTRERMEMHRANPTCNACHRFMDPIGLALDNFDVTGRLAVRENGMPLDTRGDFYDGTPINDPGRADRRAAQAARPAGAHLHREPDGLRAGPARRVLRPADGPRHRRQAAGERLPHVLVRPRRREERRVPAEAFRGPGVDRRRPGRGETSAFARPSTNRGDDRCSSSPESTCPAGPSCAAPRATVALPFLDAMVPAGRLLAQGAGAHAPGLHRGSARAGGLQRLGRDEVPLRAREGRPGLRARADNPLKPLEPCRDYLTIVSNTDVRMAEPSRRPRSAATTSARARCS